MPIVAQGGDVTLVGVVGHSNGNPADDPSLTLTVVAPLGATVAGFPVGIPPIVRDSLGVYHYDWTVPALLAVGNYTATWNATVDGANASGSEQVEVVAAGSVSVSVGWPMLEELKQVLDVTSDDWDGDDTNTRLTRLLAAAVAKVKADVGAWDELVDTPDENLAQAALRMAELLALKPEIAKETATDPTYLRLLYGHRRTFGIA